MAVWMMDDDAGHILERLIKCERHYVVYTRSVYLRCKDGDKSIDIKYTDNSTENQKILMKMRSEVKTIFTECDDKYLEDPNFMNMLYGIAIQQKLDKLINHKSILDFLYKKTRDIDINYIGI